MTHILAYAVLACSVVALAAFGVHNAAEDSKNPTVDGLTAGIMGVAMIAGIAAGVWLAFLVATH